MDKYRLLTEVAKTIDERDHLREENDILERELHEFKVTDGAGEMTPFVRKVFEYGRQALFDKCFRVDWYAIGVKDFDGEPYPERNLSDWSEDVFHSSNLPSNISKDELFEICAPLLAKEYDKKWDREKSDWLEEHGNGEGE